MVGFFPCAINKPEKDLCCPNSAFLRRRWATSFARELRGDEWDVFPPPRSWRGSSSRYHTGLSSRKAFCRSTVHSPGSHTSCSINKRNKLYKQILSTIFKHRCHTWHCATNRQVARSIPDSVIGIFHLRSPSSRIKALGSGQLLTEINTRNISWGVKPAGA